jgi:mevalonate kinase
MAGSWAALIPYPVVGAKLAFPAEDSNQSVAGPSNLSLRKFAGYLTDLTACGVLPACLDLERLHRDLGRGMYLDSTIPQHYGLGSSGAVCAAVLSVYGKLSHPGWPLSLADLRTFFGGMESFFHGTSSGVDPLTILMGEPLVIRDGEYLRPGRTGRWTRNAIIPFLIDSGRASLTGPHVSYFYDRMKDNGYRKVFMEDYIPLLNRAVEQWLEGKLQADTITEISLAQQVCLKPMIPGEFQKVWKAGINTGLYACKLCGSGGGGMILGFTGDLEETGKFLKKNFGIRLIRFSGK